jgi:hypothetical protein
MTDIADKIYAATGLTLNAQEAAKIGQMIQAENEKLRAALKEIKSVAFVKPKDFEYRRVSLFAQIVQIAQVALGEKE